jgi:hypothetical protein
LPRDSTLSTFSVSFHGLYGGLHDEFDAFGFQVCLHGVGHVLVGDPGYDLVHHLDDRHILSYVDEGQGEFETYDARSGDYDLVGFLQIALDGLSVVDGPDHEHSGEVGPLYRGDEHLSSGGQDEGVVLVGLTSCDDVLGHGTVLRPVVDGVLHFGLR